MTKLARVVLPSDGSRRIVGERLSHAQDLGWRCHKPTDTKHANVKEHTGVTARHASLPQEPARQVYMDACTMQIATWQIATRLSGAGCEIPAAHCSGHVQT
jgi:hypothetical protein